MNTIRMKKSVAILLSLCMVLIMTPMMPVTVHATDAQRITITDGKNSYTLPSGMTWSKETSTLTLNGYNGGGIDFDNYQSSGDKKVIVKLEGTNTITVKDTNYGMKFKNIVDATFAGSGSLTINVTGEDERFGIFFDSSQGVISPTLKFTETSIVTLNIQQDVGIINGIDIGKINGFMNINDSNLIVSEDAMLNISLKSGGNYPIVALNMKGSVTINGEMNIIGTYTGSNPVNKDKWIAMFSKDNNSIGTHAAVTLNYPNGTTGNEIFSKFKLEANGGEAIGNNGWSVSGDTKEYMGSGFSVKLSDKQNEYYADYEYKAFPEVEKPICTFSFDGSNAGKLTGTTTNMKYSLDGGSTWEGCTSASTDLSSKTITETKDIKIKNLGDGSTTSDSKVQTIDITKPASPTTPIAVDCTTYRNNDGKIKNVTTAMEYQKDGDAIWTAGTGNDITDLVNGTYYVRFKTTDHSLASDKVTLTIQEKSIETLTGTVIISGNAKYNEELTASYTFGNNSGTLNYQWKRGTTNIGDNSDKYTIIEADIGSTITCTVTSSIETGSITSTATETIEKADGPLAPTGLTPTKPSAPGESDGKISGVNTTMEYSEYSEFSSNATCTSTEIKNLEAGTYYVRIAETSTTKVGAYATVIVPANTDYLTFADNVAYDIPIGDVGTTYTSTTALSATGGKAPYIFTVEPSVSGLSINGENKLVYTRPNIATAATTVTIKVTDSLATTKAITINIGVVTRKNIETATVSGISNKKYTGTAITQPGLTIKVGTTTLTEGTDYTVSYTNNTNVGTATITIAGKGDYQGTITKTFTITNDTTPTPSVPTPTVSASETPVSVAVAKVKKISKITAKFKSKKVSVTWTKLKCVKGYQIKVGLNSKVTKSAKPYMVTKNTAKKTIKYTKIKKGKKLYIKVRAYKVVEGKKVYGEYCKVKVVKVK